jgi:site-specific recombinase
MLNDVTTFIRRWRSADHSQLQLDALIDQADANAPIEARNAWLIELGFWIRREDALTRRIRFGTRRRAVRLRYLLQLLDRDEARRDRVVATVQSIFRDLDGVSLLCDTGLPQNASFWSELRERSVAAMIPATPNTLEWGRLLSQLFPTRADLVWLSNLDPETWSRLLALFASPQGSRGRALSDTENSIRFLISQVRAVALSSAIRSRMDISDFDASPFLPLEQVYDRLLAALRLQVDPVDQGRDQALTELAQQLNLFRALLSQCEQAVSTVFAHFADHGVSVDIEFRVESILARLRRIEALLPLLLPQADIEHRQILIELLRAHQSSLSNLRLARQSFARLARKVVDRSAETGEHYITRSEAEYRHMLYTAAGGGALTAVTVYFKFFITGWHLPRLFEGILASLNYAGSFVLLQLVGFTLATKQPAMTAPALAERIDHLGQPDGMAEFVEETVNLLRSQAVAVFGNVALVVPLCYVIERIAMDLFGFSLISADKAHATIDSFSLLGPTPLFAIWTGVLLWLSSLFAGWADNWFVYRGIGAVIAHHRRVRLVLGVSRAERLARYMRAHISGFAGNISLGFLLGMTPFLGGLLALPLEVRHVTLSAGGVATSMAVLGRVEISTRPFWLALAGVLAMAFLNVGVSFMLAFQLALRSRSLKRSERYAIYRALLNVMLRRPQTVLMMPRGRTVDVER